jgi:alkylated DNA repair dioxygenase AlkB
VDARRATHRIERTFEETGYAGSMTAALTGCALQGSLWDVGEEAGLRELGGSVRRTALSRGAWLDLRPAWATGSDALFARLVDVVPWHGERRQMYERVVDVPRLLSFYGEGEPLPDPLLEQARTDLSHHYAGELGEPFVTAGLCLYRDGRDSVAWHGDTIGRSSTEDTMVAILSLGAPRPLLLRPRGGGGETLRHQLGHGDLVVMGGSCQRTWEHAIPKTARPVGPRISVQFRTRGVR